jgi:predicted SnoaL-like aldol condensation-catalyzing enzyme
LKVAIFPRRICATPGDSTWLQNAVFPSPHLCDAEVAEHWDVMQEEVPADKTANGNAMFTPT